MKIRTGQYVDLANLLPENIKTQDSEPQTYLGEAAHVFQEDGMRDYRYSNLGGSLYCVYVDLSLHSPIYMTRHDSVQARHGSTMTQPLGKI